MSCDHNECKELAYKLNLVHEVYPPQDEFYGSREDYEEVYPCFHEPENFVKLLEIDLFLSSETFFFFTKRPQQQLIDIIKNKITVDNKARKLYINQIQQVKWSY